MKEVFAPHLGHNVKLGRLPRPPGGRRIHLSDFISHAALPSIPASCDFSPKAAVPLADVYENDALGDCVVAGGNHLVGVWTGNAGGTPFHATSAQIIADYSAIGGYKPGDPSTDQGCNEETAFSYWTKHGFANGTKLLGAISINASSRSDVMAACFLFENLFFGIGLPDAWIDPFPSASGFTWGVNGAADPNNGHCIVSPGAFGPAGAKIDSWGLIGTITWDAIAAYCGPSAGGELYALLTADMVAKGQAKAPNGLAWADLVAAFDALGGNVPVPSPTPAPPASFPTAAQVEAWAKSGIAGMYKQGMSLKQAEACASSGVAAHWPH